MDITSSAFDHGDAIPKRHTCDGEDLSPPLAFSDVPEGTESLALIVDDPDAPGGIFVHWILWDLSPSTTELPEGVSGDAKNPEGITCSQGKNHFDDVGYRGPCPPGGTHTYRFTLYALDSKLELGLGAERDDLDEAMGGHIIEEARLIGRYGR